MFAAPVTGFVASLLMKDYQGTKQIVLSGATNLAATYTLKYLIKKNDPTTKTTMLFHPITPLLPFREQLSFNAVTDGNGVFRHTPCLLISAGDEPTAKNTTGGT